jgi:hypothetical protein
VSCSDTSKPAAGMVIDRALAACCSKAISAPGRLADDY